MKKYDWKVHIKMTIWMLRVLGMWPKGDEVYEPGLYAVHAAFLLVVFLLGHLFFQSANIYFIRDDLEAITGTIYVLLMEILVVFKVLYVAKNMDMLKQLLKTLESDLFQPKSAEQKALIESSIYFWRIIYQMLLTMGCGNNLFWALFPLLDKTAGEKRLPFLAWYPYNTTISPLYEITYIYQIVSVGLFATVHVNLDALVTAITVFNASQFDILCDNLRNLHVLTDSTGINDKLINCIEHHKQTLSYADKCNKFLKWILLVQFFIFTISIGISMFQLTLLVPLSGEFLSLLAYGFAITLEIFMYCWSGNEVEVKSRNIPYAVFECEWTDFPEDVKKKLLFFTMRAQVPVKLSALNLIYLSLDTFMKAKRFV
ncbi:odorant receptor Or1-like [Tenebrio molitor]|uniref:odorant receptor Or1-like n=1 Tax=Tenebrio molitor TaxID=7067 RepID=UPI003624A868